MGSFNFGHNGREFPQLFLVHTSAIGCRSVDMQLQSNTSLKSCRLLNKIAVQDIKLRTNTNTYLFKKLPTEKNCNCGATFLENAAEEVPSSCGVFSGHKKRRLPTPRMSYLFSLVASWQVFVLFCHCLDPFKFCLDNWFLSASAAKTTRCRSSRVFPSHIHVPFHF